MECKYIHLRYGKVLQTKTSPIIEEQYVKDVSLQQGFLSPKTKDMVVKQSLEKELENVPYQKSLSQKSTYTT